ncbi:hypothetical protein [Altererythrobacter sp. TH136]|uniref:hypothetical protein n=1 Tax=Altererythrobacter sp. TH136 TaxID=2067415 RepID=UPI001163EF07|nr:hypothetical protein [Altererythrobacter sp. TH136]QDM40635.1 hypothetical protein C0V74_05945 [Altererythrobacter sp. TH136]
MRSRTILATASVIALAAGTLYLWDQGGVLSGPPTMTPAGETTDDSWIVKRRSVDYEAIIKSVLAEKASFLTLTLAQDIVRDRHLEKSIAYTPLPASRARVRVKYHVEYPIGFNLAPGNFAVSGGPDRLVITLRRPQLVAQPSVRLKSYQVLDSGYLIDEKTALLKLQQRIQPEAVAKSRAILKRRDILPRSEKVLRGFLNPILKQQAGGEPAPQIEFRYR